MQSGEIKKKNGIWNWYCQLEEHKSKKENRHKRLIGYGTALGETFKICIKKIGSLF